MDKLQLAGRNLGRVFNSRSGCTHTMYFNPCKAKRPNLKLKTWPKQLLGCLTLDIVLPATTQVLAGAYQREATYGTLLC